MILPCKTRRCLRPAPLCRIRALDKTRAHPVSRTRPYKTLWFFQLLSLCPLLAPDVNELHDEIEVAGVRASVGQTGRAASSAQRIARPPVEGLRGDVTSPDRVGIAGCQACLQFMLRSAVPAITLGLRTWCRQLQTERGATAVPLIRLRGSRPKRKRGRTAFAVPPR